MKKKTGRARSIVAWAVMLCVLGGMIWYTNKPDTAEAAATEAAETVAETADDTPVGYEVGQKCPDFTVSLYGADGGEFTLSEMLGKPTVINFWATWCTPCVAELPYFQQLSETYGDQINLIAIHSSLVTDDVQAFLDGEGLSIPFGQDDSDGSVIASLGGSTMLPMTVVVDQNGIIVYNQVGSVTYEKLDSLVAPLLQ